MLRNIVVALLCLVVMPVFADGAGPFDFKASNDELRVYIRLNLHDRDLEVPGQAFLGKVDGYIGSTRSSSLWIIVDSRIVDETTAEIDVVNEYGSEDFTAVVKIGPDGSCSYAKKSGSALKFAVAGKWQKMPTTIVFKK